MPRNIEENTRKEPQLCLIENQLLFHYSIFFMVCSFSGIIPENLHCISNIINAKIYGNTFLKVIDEVVIRKVVDCHDKAEPS